MKEFKLFINGEFRDSSENKTYETLNKFTQEPIGKVHLPSSKDIEDAVEAAENASLNPEWRNATTEQKANWLFAISEKLKERAREFSTWEIQDSASTLRKAKADVHNAASFFKVMGKTIQNFSFTEIDEKASRPGFSKNMRKYEPVGVCAQIIPWNFPLVMAAWKIAPVLATGCTTVLKTAKETPVTACLLAEIIQEVGIPKGVINIITGDAEEGKQLISHPKVRKIAFTGSTAVGREVMKAASESVKKVSLELGGKSANIILNDADLDIAVDGSLYAFLYHSGQACDSGTRLLIQDGIYEDFVKRFKSRIEEITIGNPGEKTTGFGPVINKKQFDIVMGYIEKTKSEGAPLITGGERITGGDFDKGYYIKPTAFEITPDNSIFHEEIFGPVVGITKFKSEEDAIKLANNSEYGLAGSVFSQDTQKAMAVAGALETGTVWINEYHLLNPGMPFGGYKQSGIGREMGREGLDAYLEVKHIWQSDCDKREQKVWFDALF